MYPNQLSDFNILFVGRTQSTNESELNLCQENFTFNDVTSSVNGGDII